MTCQKAEPASVDPVSALAYAPVIPILKGLDENPVLRIAVYNPDEKNPTYPDKIKLSVAKSNLSDIQSIHIYENGIEPLYKPGAGFKTYIPESDTFLVPLENRFNPGLNFIWISVIPRPQASMDQTIYLKSHFIIHKDQTSTTIQQDPNQKNNRIGIVLKKAGDQGINTFRIPGIVKTKTGSLVAVYDIRYTNSSDLPGHIDVGMSRSTNKGQSWEPMKIIMDMGPPQEQNGIGDPSILYDEQTHTIWVAALWSKGNRSIAGSGPGLTPDETGQFVLVSSVDDGNTWSQPYSITSMIKNPAWKIFFQGPGVGTVMKDGTLVFPAQYWDPAGIPHSTIIYSKDHGLTWKSGTGAKTNTTESQVVETVPGTLMLNMRDNRGSFRSIALSKDLGSTWIEHPGSYSALSDPVCMGSLIKAQIRLGQMNKEILFFCNPNTSTGRKNITIKASSDLGNSWDESNQLLIDERTCYGYSSMVIIDPEHIGLVYEGTKDLYFLKIPVDDIVKK